MDCIIGNMANATFASNLKESSSKAQALWPTLVVQRDAAKVASACSSSPSAPNVVRKSFESSASRVYYRAGASFESAGC